MPGNAGEFSNCSHCGAPNPISATTCTYCGGRIAPAHGESPPINPAPPDHFQLVSSEEPPSSLGVGLLILGILLVIVGVILLGVAASVHQSVQSFNNACSQNPVCQPQSDPSGAITGGGVGAIVLGILLVAVGAYLRSR